MRDPAPWFVRETSKGVTMDGQATRKAEMGEAEGRDRI
jgi:hypothetical protein